MPSKGNNIDKREWELIDRKIEPERPRVGWPERKRPPVAGRDSGGEQIGLLGSLVSCAV